MMWKSSKIPGESFENHRETIGGNIGQPWESQGHHGGTIGKSFGKYRGIMGKSKGNQREMIKPFW